MYECEICGARLDPGEKCDCEKEDEETSEECEKKEVKS